MHGVIHVHANRPVILADERHHRERLVGRTIGIRLLPPLLPAVEQIAIDVQIHLRGAIANSCWSESGLCVGHGRDDGIRNRLRGWRASAAEPQCVRAVSVRARDEEILCRALCRRDGSGQGVEHHRIPSATDVHAHEDRAARPVVDDNRSHEQMIADGIGGDGELTLPWA